MLEQLKALETNKVTGLEMSIADQQERPIMFDLGWFCGALESEGSFSLACGRNHDRLQIVPKIAIANKDKDFVDNILRIASMLGIATWAKYDDGNGMGRVNFYGFKRVNRALDVFGPHLVTKRNRAGLVKGFIRSRENQPQVNSPYSPFEYWCFRELRRANNNGRDRDKAIDKEVNGILRDFMPTPEDLSLVKIKSSLQGNL